MMLVMDPRLGLLVFSKIPSDTSSFVYLALHLHSPYPHQNSR